MKAAKKKIPTISRMYVYGVVHPTTPAWFHAKLNKIRPTTPVIVPVKSKEGFEDPIFRSFSSAGRIRKLVAVNANRTIPITQYVHGHQTNSANIAANTDPSTAPPIDH
jgi:hypothetical protein